MNYTNQMERSLGITLVLCCNGITVFDTCCHSVNYQRIKEVT